MDESNESPKFDVGSIVRRKFSGLGKVDQVRPSSTGYQYHVNFQSGLSMWAIEQDLETPSKELLKTTGYLKEAA